MNNSKFISKNPKCKFNIAKNVIFGENIVFGSNCNNIKIGHGSYLGSNIYIDLPELEIGDYTTIHNNSTIHGIKTSIGHNCWIGQFSIIDSLGGHTKIGNNVGIGAHSQLWSHMKFGDMLAGCRWNSTGKLDIRDDVWLVGHSIVGPIIAKEKSMLLTGGVMMKNMEANKIYAGNPAQIVEKLGGQFQKKTYREKKDIFTTLLSDFYNKENLLGHNKFLIVSSFTKKLHLKGYTQFNLEKQTYMPQYNRIELKFIKFMLYDKAKFIPDLKFVNV